MKISLNIPDSSLGDWEVKSFEINQKEASEINLELLFIDSNRIISPGKYTKLSYKDQIIMSNTPAEIREHSIFINEAMKSESVLINGLGLGMCVKKILESNIEKITVIEKSKTVIDLVSPYLQDNRIIIINEDALTYTPPKGEKYCAVWHDIWPTIDEENIPEMKKLHYKYRYKTKWQDSWARHKCESQRRKSKRFAENRIILEGFMGKVIV